MKIFIMATAIAVTVSVLLISRVDADTPAKATTDAQSRTSRVRDGMKRRRAQKAKLNQHDKSITDIDRTGVLNIPGTDLGSLLGPDILAFSAERQDSLILLTATVTNTAKQDLTDMEFTYSRYTGTGWLPLKFDTKTLLSDKTRTFSVKVPVINEAVRLRVEISGHGKKTSKECRLAANLKRFVVRIDTKGKWVSVAQLEGNNGGIQDIISNLKSLGFEAVEKKSLEDKFGYFHHFEVLAFGANVQRTFDTREDARQYVQKVWSAFHSTTTTNVSVAEQ